MDVNLRKVLLASAVGSALEWYDFFIYGMASALVFGDLFFPKFDAATGTLLSFATFAVGFVARPFGGMVFGHLGDKLGRKPVLVITLLLVGVGTFLIGFLPTYQQAGIIAPILLVLLRIIQGFGAGAEYGGAVLLAVEHAPPGKRGYFGSWAPIGVTAGLLIANGVFALFALLPPAEFASWGWRIPFLLSIVLIATGLYIRARVTETPVFQEAIAKRKPVRSPVIDAVLHHPREFLVVLGARLAENGLGFLFPLFTLNYLTKTLHMAKTPILLCQMFGYAVSLFTIPMFSALSDRIGRRTVYMGAAIFCALFAFPYFWMISTQSIPLILLAFTLAVGVGIAGMFGPQAAYFAELFSTRLRYSGFAFARELGSLLAGGPAPALSTMLVTSAWGLNGVAVYVIALALLTAIALWFGPETNRSDLRAEPVRN